jgi:hypothetical protein
VFPPGLLAAVQTPFGRFTSIAFFKRLLCRRGVISVPVMRAPGFVSDPYNERIADELIDLYLSLEADAAGPP